MIHLVDGLIVHFVFRIVIELLKLMKVYRNMISFI